MRGKLIGMVILVAAIALAWGIVALGQAHAGDWIARLAGPARASDGSVVETLFTFIVFAPLIVIALIGAAIDGRNALTPGVRPAGRLALGLGVGFAGLTMSMLYALVAGTLASGTAPGASAGLLLWGLGVVALQTVAEEVYFRGWLQPALTARWGTAAGVIAAALAFAALHVAGGARAPLSLVNLFLGGLMFGLFAAQGRGIAGAVGVHFAWNASEQLLYGLDPNPGIGGFGAVVDKDLIGATVWGGSGDGLNGSIGMAVVLLAILAPLVMLGWRRLAPAPARRSALTT